MSRKLIKTIEPFLYIPISTFERKINICEASILQPGTEVVIWCTIPATDKVSKMTQVCMTCDSRKFSLFQEKIINNNLGCGLKWLKGASNIKFDNFKHTANINLVISNKLDDL